MRNRNGLGFLEEFGLAEEYFDDSGGGGYYDDYYADSYYSDPYADWDWEDFVEAGGEYYSDPYVELPTFDTEPWAVETPIYSPSVSDAGIDPYFENLNYYLGEGYSTAEADRLAQEAAEYSFQIETEPAAFPVAQLPNLAPWPIVSYAPDYSFPTLFPPIEYPTVAPPPPLPQSPATQQQKLPPACPQGQYHPYPIGHPQQDVCEPFPAYGLPPTPKPSAQAPTPQAPKPPAQQPRPPAQQQCPPGYSRDPLTGQCKPAQSQQPNCPPGYYPNYQTRRCEAIPKCTTSGTVFDARTGRCVPYNQAQQPLCPVGYWPNFQTQRCEVIPTCAPGLVFDVNKAMCVTPAASSEGDVLSELKNLPWWLWAGLGALLLLNRDDQGGKKVTVQHRRAS